MAFEFVLLATLVTAASAGLIPEHEYASLHQTIQHHHSAPVHHVAAVHAAPVHHTIVKEVEHHAPANYEFSYSVHDEHTGDIKSQHETRHGDEVHGQYSLIDSDGHHRIVDYHADHHSGYNAVVRREPTHVKIAQPVHKVIAQPVHVAAVSHHHAAPVHHVAQYSHIAAPVAHSAIQTHHGFSHYSTGHHY